VLRDIQEIQRLQQNNSEEQQLSRARHVDGPTEVEEL
jgi:hypothetical protein